MMSDLDDLLGDLERTCQSQNSPLSPTIGTKHVGNSIQTQSQPKTDRNLNDLDCLLMDLSKSKYDLNQITAVVKFFTFLVAFRSSSRNSDVHVIPAKTKETEAVMREMQESPRILDPSKAAMGPNVDSNWKYMGYGIWEPENNDNAKFAMHPSHVSVATNGQQQQQQQQQQPVPSAASSATQELDDLMSSLNTFKINKNNPTEGEESQAMASTATTSLDDMLGDLQEDMSKQGVKLSAKGVCFACDKTIVGQVITALGKTWHPEHFTCEHCNQELRSQNFFERDGKSFCEEDYHRLFSPRCHGCREAILDRCISALDETWHPHCFVCFECKQDFGNEGYHEKNDEAFCKRCFSNKFAPKCGGCEEPILESYITSLEKQWHPSCFVCFSCKQPFSGGNFFEHDGKPYCETHFHTLRGSLCAGCQKPISGRCITAMFKKFHPEHFVCSFCLKQLNKGTFKERKEKPYCHECHERLFG